MRCLRRLRIRAVCVGLYGMSLFRFLSVARNDSPGSQREGFSLFSFLPFAF